MPPPVRKGVLAGGLVVIIRAWHKVVPFIAFTVLAAYRDFHPPALAFIAAVKDHFVFKIFQCHRKFNQVFFLVGREIAFATLIAINEIPDHLPGQLGCLRLAVKPWIDLIKADRSQLIAKSGIAHDLADLFPVETIW